MVFLEGFEVERVSGYSLRRLACYMMAILFIFMALISWLGYI